MRGFGQGIATIARRDGAILEVWYPHIGLDDYRPEAVRVVKWFGPGVVVNFGPGFA
jgi:hypothetical protein